MTATAPTTVTTLARRIAAAACRPGAFHRSDGQVLTGYFDEYLLAGDPHLLAETAAALAALVPAGADAVAGLELGGIPIVAALSAASGLPALFVRKEPKTYGTRRHVEGPCAAGSRVLLVDDVVRSGAQMLRAAAVLRELGAEVTGALCLVDRESGGRAALAARGIGLHALMTGADLDTATGGTP